MCGISAAVSVLVVVHPHFEHIALDTKLGAELIERHVILPLYPPPDPLRELKHLILLFLRELRPEPLGSGGTSSSRSNHCPTGLHSLRRFRPSITAIVTMMRTGRGGTGIVKQHWSRSRKVPADHLPHVEVSVATARSASERLTGVSSTTWHELAAAVVGVAAHGSRMVPHALPVLNNGFNSRLGARQHRFEDSFFVIVILGFRYVIVGYHA